MSRMLIEGAEEMLLKGDALGRGITERRYSGASSTKLDVGRGITAICCRRYWFSSSGSSWSCET
jgi:hypothetical protein